MFSLISCCSLWWVWLISRALRTSLIWVMSFGSNRFVFSVVVLIFEVGLKWMLGDLTVAMDNLPVFPLCDLVGFCCFLQYDVSS